MREAGEMSSCQQNYLVSCVTRQHLSWRIMESKRISPESSIKGAICIGSCEVSSVQFLEALLEGKYSKTDKSKALTIIFSPPLSVLLKRGNKGQNTYKWHLEVLQLQHVKIGST